MRNKIDALNLNELEQVSGGVIVDTNTIDRSARYKIVDDNTGEIRFSVNSKTTAEQLAGGTFHTSTDVITPQEYESKFGKAFTG